MKLKIFLLIAALVMCFAVITPAKPAPKVDKKANHTKVIAKKTAIQKQAFPNIFKIFQPLFTFLNANGTYRSVEKNVFHAMPEKMPKEYKCSVGGSFVRVHALSPPSANECGRITRSFQKVLRNTTGNFAALNGLTPPEAFKGWTLFDQPKEYRAWLLEDEGRGRIAPAESESIRGCPIIKTSNSATGYASGITAGFKFMWGGEVRVNYPFVVVARLSPEQEQNAACTAHQEDAWYNEFEHLRTVNRVKVNGRWYQSYHSYEGENDRHPIFKDQ